MPKRAITEKPSEGLVYRPGRNEIASLLGILERRIDKKPQHYKRPEVDFAEIRALLRRDRDAMASVFLLEDSGGKPDVISADKKELIIAACSQETPLGCRGQDYNEAIHTAKGYGVGITPWEFYLNKLHTAGEFDTQTKSWLDTPQPKKQPFNPHSIIDILCVPPLPGESSVGDFGFRLRNAVCRESEVASYKSENLGWRGMISLPRHK